MQKITEDIKEDSGIIEEDKPDEENEEPFIVKRSAPLHDPRIRFGSADPRDMGPAKGKRSEQVDPQ